MRDSTGHVALAFDTDNITLLDLVLILRDIGYERHTDYKVLGKFGKSHVIELMPHANSSGIPTSVAAAISLTLPPGWYGRVRPYP